LQFAEKQFNWVDQNLTANNGLYADHVRKDGWIDPAQYTYNQGLMLGDATMLYQATGDPKYLDKAVSIANNSLETFFKNLADGYKQKPFFNAVYFKNLMLLDSELRSTSGRQTNPAYRQALADYSQYVKKEIDPRTGMIVTADGHDDHKTGSTALDQASAVQILELAEQYPPS
jgi:predicted alpha-1,6-mannanase (GH76 family)